MREIRIKFSNRTLYTLIAVVVLVLAVVGVYASNSGGPPSFVGHTAEELDLSGGVNGNAIFNDNVGIGTASPQQKLDIAGYIRSRASSGILQLAETDNSNVWWLVADGNYFSIRKNNQGPYPLTIADSENVGIGTTTPQGKLDVNGDICIKGDCINNWSDVSIQCDWEGEKPVFGSVHGCEDDLYITCTEGVITKASFGC